VNVTSIIKNESMIIRILVVVFGLVLAVVLIGLWQYGFDLSSIFLGTPWNSPLPHTQGVMALEVGIVAITLLFGGLFVGGLMALIARR